MLSLSHAESLDKTGEAGPACNSHVARGPQGGGSRAGKALPETPRFLKPCLFTLHTWVCAEAARVRSRFFLLESKKGRHPMFIIVEFFSAKLKKYIKIVCSQGTEFRRFTTYK